MNRVVITGMGAVTPIGNSVDALWESLISGKNGIGPISRFDVSEYKAKLAFEVKDFAPEKHLDKSDIRRNDLYSQYALVAALDAFIDSGLEGKFDPERFGVYFSSGIGGLDTLTKEVIKLHEKGPKRVSPFMIPMMIANMAAGAIAVRLGAHGPAVPVVTACATGSNALGEALRAIRHGYADVIMAGGSEASITPVGLAGFINMMALSTSDETDSACVPFDRRRSGFVMGEGAGALVLEELEHAKKRGAKIYAEFVGYGSSCDAYHITAPEPEGIYAAGAITAALKEAGYSDRDSVYYNAHGTSTPLNDKGETLALKRAFGDRAHDILISSTKSMTGHMLGAAGAVEAIAAIMALRESIVPPTINYREKDEDCDLDYVPNEARRQSLDLALSSSFGFGGHNACLAFRKYED